MSRIKGWCPGALRPMESGDGLVVRLRPHGGRLTQQQAAGIASAAQSHGNGVIELTGRANLQLRGVTWDSHQPLIRELRHLNLVDHDATTESRRNIIVTPFADSETDRLAAELETALAASGLTLPSKFGFAVDSGSQRVLSRTPADIRLERSVDGCLILRADGMEHGAPFNTVQDAIALARWFLIQSDGTCTRMAALLAKRQGGQSPDQAIFQGATIFPARALSTPGPGPKRRGLLAGFAFGQIDSSTFLELSEIGPLRLTPWRMLLIEGATSCPPLPGLILDPDDPLLRLRACIGAPSCTQALAATRPLARRLAGRVPRGQTLHVSGCAKGCGCPHPADLTLTATPDGFDLIRKGRASDPPDIRAIAADQLEKVM